MRAPLVALALLIALAGPAQADTDLESLVANAFLPRSHSASLHDIAHQRAIEVVTDWGHDGMRSGTAEVLAWNSGYGADSMAHAIAQWIGSPGHAAILSDPSLTQIGCASYSPDERTFFVCVLARGAVSYQPTPAPWSPPPVAPSQTKPAPDGPEPVLLPDTAMAP